jgi:hypothetical protein
MSERGESLDPVRMLNVASWWKLRPPRGRVQRSLESQNLRPPNMRVQRTRSSASPLRSPLTRHPLCIGKFRAAWSPRHRAARPVVAGKGTGLARETRNHDRGERTRFGKLPGEARSRRS